MLSMGFIPHADSREAPENVMEAVGVSGPERLATPALADHVRILDVEARALQALLEVDDAPLDVVEARGVDEHP